MTGVEVMPTSGLNKRALHMSSDRGIVPARFVEKADLPERRVAGTIGVEGVDAVVLGGDVETSCVPLPGNFDAGHEEWLRVDRAVDFECAEFAELFGIDVLRSEDLLVEIRAVRALSYCEVVTWAKRKS